MDWHRVCIDTGTAGRCRRNYTGYSFGRGFESRPPCQWGGSSAAERGKMFLQFLLLPWQNRQMLEKLQPPTLVAAGSSPAPAANYGRVAQSVEHEYFSILSYRGLPPFFGTDAVRFTGRRSGASRRLFRQPFGFKSRCRAGGMAEMPTGCFCVPPPPFTGGCGQDYIGKRGFEPLPCPSGCGTSCRFRRPPFFQAACPPIPRARRHRRERRCRKCFERLGSLCNSR